MKFLLLLFLFLFGCHGSKNYIGEEHIHGSLPIQSFVFIEQELDIKLCAMGTTGCFDVVSRNTGSGVFVGKSYEEFSSYILTVEHICSEPSLPLENDNMPGVTQHLLDHRLIINDFEGNKHKAKIIRTDKKNDLCLLEINNLALDIVQIAEADPLQHERIWNIAAPAAIWSPKSVVIFDGYFDGIGTENQSVYSMPTSPGSSGSPILNRKKELVGIISSSSVNWNVGFGANRQDIANFIRVYMPTDLDLQHESEEF